MKTNEDVLKAMFPDCTIAEQCSECWIYDSDGSLVARINTQWLNFICSSHLDILERERKYRKEAKRWKRKFLSERMKTKEIEARQSLQSTSTKESHTMSNKYYITSYPRVVVDDRIIPYLTKSIPNNSMECYFNDPTDFIQLLRKYGTYVEDSHCFVITEEIEKFIADISVYPRPQYQISRDLRCGGDMIIIVWEC